MTKVEQIQKAIKALSIEDRIEIVRWISSQGYCEDESIVDQEWLEVARRRSEEIKFGKTKTVSAESVKEQLKAEHGIDV